MYAVCAWVKSGGKLPDEPRYASSLKLRRTQNVQHGDWLWPIRLHCMESFLQMFSRVDLDCQCISFIREAA
jgi:hypothetical protein